MDSETERKRPDWWHKTIKTTGVNTRPLTRKDLEECIDWLINDGASWSDYPPPPAKHDDRDEDG